MKLKVKPPVSTSCPCIYNHTIHNWIGWDTEWKQSTLLAKQRRKPFIRWKWSGSSLVGPYHGLWFNFCELAAVVVTLSEVALLVDKNGSFHGCSALKYIYSKLLFNLYTCTTYPMLVKVKNYCKFFIRTLYAINDSLICMYLAYCTSNDAEEKVCFLQLISKPWIIYVYEFEFDKTNRSFSAKTKARQLTFYGGVSRKTTRFLQIEISSKTLYNVFYDLHVPKRKAGFHKTYVHII